MRRLRWISTLVIYFVLVGGTPVLAADLDAGGPSSRPKTSGPVSLESEGCSDRAVKSDSGETLGRAEVCILVYDFDNLSELDVLRDYGAGWFQARFVPAAGWCATEVAAELTVSGGTAEAISKTKQARKAQTKLVLTAGGNALENAKISQNWSAAPGSIETKAGSDGPALVSTWKGKTAKPVTLVGGVGYSYPMLDGTPGTISYGFSRFSLASC